ncbi:MAG: TRAP transporter small permease [Sphaerochaetaceae bacterium]
MKGFEMKEIILKIQTYLDLLFKIVEYLAGFFLAITCIAVLAQVVGRYFFAYSFNWAEELPVVFFAWFGFLGAAVAMHRGEHLGVEFVVKSLPGELQKLLKVIVSAVGAVFFACIFSYGITFSIKMMHVSFVTFPLPKGYFYLSLVVSSALMVITLVFHLVKDIVFWKEQ